MSVGKPIFDHEFGLSQLGGNQALLDKMCVKFAKEFENSATQVKQALDAGDFDAAKIKVHTAKGISGNLGMQALYHIASTLDAQLREKRYEQSTLSSYEDILAQTCTLVAGTNTSPEAAVELVDTDKPTDIGKQELLTKLDRNEFIDDDSLVELVSSLQLQDTLAQKLISLIEELKYSEAIEMVKAV